LPVMTMSEIKEVVPPRMKHADPQLEHELDVGYPHPSETGEYGTA